MITRVVITNWRSHSKSEFNFARGTNALLGIMGSGKSSVLQALCFGFFGDLPELKARKLKLDDLITRKPQRKDFAEVEVGFALDGKQYSVRRKIEREKGTVLAELREGGNLLEGPSPAKVTKLVEKIIKVDYEMFIQAVYSEQNGIDNFLTIAKGKRMQKIDELLRIDRLEEGRKTLGKIGTRVSYSIEEKEGFLKGMKIEKMNQELQEYLGEIARLKVSEKTIAEELVKISNELVRFEKIEIGLEQKRKSVAQLEKEKFGLEKQAGDLKKRIKELGVTEAPDDSASQLKAVEAKLDLLERIEKRLNASKEDEKSLSASLAEMRKRKDVIIEELGDMRGLSAGQIEKKIKEIAENFHKEKIKAEKLRKSLPEAEIVGLEKELGWLEKETERLGRETKNYQSVREKAGNLDNVSKLFESAELEFEEARKEIGRTEAERTQTEEHLKHLKGAEGTCPVCETELDPSKKGELVGKKTSLLEELRFREGKLLSQMKEADGRRKSLSSKVEEARKAADSLRLMEEMKKQLEELERKTVKIKESLKSANQEKRKLEDEIRKVDDSTNKMQVEKWKVEGFYKLKKELEDLEYKIKLKGEQLDIVREDVSVRTEEISEKPKLEEKKTLLLKLVEFRKLSVEMSCLEEEVVKVGKKIADFEFDEEELKKTVDKVKELKELVGAKKAESKNLPGMVKEIRKRQEELEGNLRKASEYKEDIDLLKGLGEKIAILQNSFKEAQVALRKEFVHSINGAVAELWPLLYPYKDFSSIKLDIEDAKGRLGGDYILQLKEGERWVDVDGFASGGERSLACLALRMGFAKVLVPHLRWLVLDEPTHNMDAKGIEELANALRERIPQIIDQVILITHEDALEQAVGGFAYRLERNKAVDEPTRVRELLQG